jgi:hypothetical protein
MFTSASLVSYLESEYSKLAEEIRGKWHPKLVISPEMAEIIKTPGDFFNRRLLDT